MKKIVMILLLAIMASSVGCANNIEYKKSNTYEEGQDYPYSFSGSSTGIIKVQKGNNGYYFSINNFLYFADNSNMVAVPLCNKSNCLHDKETNQAKISECNAYLFNNLINTDFFYIDNKLYILKDESYYEQEQFIAVNSVYEAKSDGTSYKKLFSINKQIQRWIMHRGVIYYTTDVDGKVEGFNLSNKSTKTYFDLDEIEMYMPQMSNFFAYANNIYFCISGYKNEKEFNAMLNGENISPLEYIYVYTTDGESNYLLTSSIDRDGIVYQGFQNDCMIYTDADYDKKIKYLYSVNQNGEGSKLDVKIENIYDLYYMDNYFTYVKSGETIEDLEKNIFNVYDENRIFLTSLDLPDGFANEFFVGDDKYLFYLEDKADSINLYFIDKDELKKGNVVMSIIYNS